MISEENKKYLKQAFKIDSNKYSGKKLNDILDEIIDVLDDKIRQHEVKNLMLMNLSLIIINYG